MWGFVPLVFLVWIHYGNASKESIAKINKDEKAGNDSLIDDESLIECVVDLTQKNIIFKPTILIMENKHDDYDDVLYNKMIETFAKRDIPIAIQDKGSFEVNQTLGAFDGNVIVIAHFDNPENFSNFDIGNVDKKVKHLVIISQLTEEYYTNLVKIGNKFIERDITFIIHDLHRRKHDIVTFPPTMDSRTCRLLDVIEPKLINVCRNSSLETDDVFPYEIRVEFKSCPLKVGIASMFPFSKIEKVINGKKLKNYDLIKNIEGSDVEIIKIIAHYFNATVVWHYLNIEEQNPFSDTEYVKFIVNGSVNVSAGGLYRIYGNLVTYSGIYSRQSIIWMYAAHRTGRSWDKLVHKLEGLYLFCLFYLFYSASSYLIRKYDHERFSFNNTLLHSWGALIGGSSLAEPKSLKHKILDAFYLMLCMYLSTYINHQLVSFLTIDDPSITLKSNDDIINSGRTPYLNQKHKYFVQDSKYLGFANKSKSCGDFYDCGNKVLEDNGLTVILDEYFYPIQAATAVKDEAKILRAIQNIVTIYQEMVISKDSVIVKGFQDVLERLFEAGICEHLFKKAIGVTVVAKATSAQKNAVSNSYSCESGCAITRSQVAGVFYVWACGCLVSVIVFVIELLWKWQTRWFIV